MPALDRLAPEQRAALMLILQQGQSYDDLAELLATDTAAIRARAHAAIDAVASELAADLDPLQRGEIADYMLGQQSHSQREATRGLLAESSAARSFARAITSEMAPLMPDEPPGVPGPHPAPDVPVTARSAGAGPAPAIATPPPGPSESRGREEAPSDLERADADDSTEAWDRADQPDPVGPARSGSAAERRGARAAAPGARAPAGAGAGGRAESASALGDRAQTDGESTHPASTRLGGIVLILVAVAALVAGIVVLANSGGSSTTSTPSTGSAPGGAPPTGTGATGTSGPQGAGRVQVLANMALTAAPGSQARGAAEVVQQQGAGTRAFLIAGTGLAPSNSKSAYAAWLYNGPNDAVSLGFFSQPVGSKGQLEGTAAVPANVKRYRQIIITRETTSRPLRPGAIVLRGALRLPAG